MGIDELALWMAWYDKHDPELAKDWRSGVVASTVANANPWRKGKPRGPVDFFPGLARLAEEQNEADAERQLMAWCANVGGAVKVQKQESRK